MNRRLISSGSTFEELIGYSRAVVDGDWIFVSGTTGFDYATMSISENLLEQTEQCLKNIESVPSGRFNTEGRRPGPIHPSERFGFRAMLARTLEVFRRCPPIRDHDLSRTGRSSNANRNSGHCSKARMIAARRDSVLLRETEGSAIRRLRKLCASSPATAKVATCGTSSSTRLEFPLRRCFRL